MGTHTSSSAAARRAARQDDIGRALDGLRAIVRALRLNSHALERRIGISGAQLFVLQQLAEGPARSMNELAERTLTHQSSVSVVVSRLVERGLATRSASDSDARRTEIALSAKGRAMLRRAPVTVQSQLVEGLRRLPPARLRALAAGIEEWTRAAGVAGSQPPLLFEEPDPAKAAGKRRVRARA
jgi:DNA-binding MarR family transcriptional regulator